jgi:hypothetical protein
MTLIISYRRDDTGAITGRICDRLRDCFGSECVYMDIDSNPIGVDYRAHIDESLKRCELLLAVIGRQWLGPGEVGARRIDDPSDLVRLEVSTALAQGIRVVPLLIDDTQMPASEKLPEDLRSIKFRQAFRVDSGVDFHHHLDRLCDAIATATKTTASTTNLQRPLPPPPSLSIRKERLRQIAPEPVTIMVPPVPPIGSGGKSMLAAAALVTSIVSAGIFSLSFVALANARASAAGWAVALSLQCLPLSAAIICGHLAMRQILRDPTLSGKGLALTALIIGYIVLLPLAFLFFAAVHDS